MLLNLTLSYCEDCLLGSREERKAICTVASLEFHKIGKSPWSILVPFSPESHSHILEKIAVSSRKASKSKPICFSSVYLAQTAPFGTITTLSHRRSQVLGRQDESKGVPGRLQWTPEQHSSQSSQKASEESFPDVWREGKIRLVRALHNLSAEISYVLTPAI